MSLIELAERCEKATGPDRRLDAEIDIAVRGFPERAYNAANGMRSKNSPDIDRIEWFIKWGASKYTVSLDAAMTLVPEGWMEFDVDATAPELGIDWTLYHRKERVKATAATPALALTAASLRALEQTGKGKTFVTTGEVSE